MVQGLGFRVQGLGFRVEGLGFREHKRPAAVTEPGSLEPSTQNRKPDTHNPKSSPMSREARRRKKALNNTATTCVSGQDLKEQKTLQTTTPKPYQTFANPCKTHCVS